METIDHALEIACRIFSDCAKINMDAHNDADRKTSDDMKKVSKIEPAETQKTVQGNFRIQEPPAGKDHKGHNNIHQDDIRYLLQGIELVLLAHGERGIRFFKNADGIVYELFHKPVKEPFDWNYVMGSIWSKEISKEKNNIAG